MAGTLKYSTTELPVLLELRQHFLISLLVLLAVLELLPDRCKLAKTLLVRRTGSDTGLLWFLVRLRSNAGISVIILALVIFTVSRFFPVTQLVHTKRTNQKMRDGKWREHHLNLLGHVQHEHKTIFNNTSTSYTVP